MARCYRRPRNGSRRGVAAAELAVCLPVLVLLVLGMIEACTMIFLKQSLTVAAYEGVRTALAPHAVAANVRTTCNRILDDRRVEGGSITVEPANFELLPAGEYVRITVTAPAEGNSIIPPSFFRGRTLSASATMMKEF